ncbi:hypothetical protein QCA50_018638 [Cerrena zonata]|uniref:G-protein coupled receptors family 1 profile domain-containing protein n=1 Tax=Cerrena zonata TaxID=2478898 RepID=A0AAW0FGQ9_9APHY
MSSLSQDDIDALTSIGHETTQTIVCLVVEAIMYTFFFILVIMAGRIQFRKGSRLSVTMFGVILIIFLLDTAGCVLDVNNAIREITLTLTSTSSLSLSDRYASTFNLPYSISNSLFAYMICFGDVIIVWRAYVFWCYGKGRLIMILPIFTLIGTFGIAGVLSFCVARDMSTSDNFVTPPFCHHIQQDVYSLSLGTTAISTALTCFKTWTYRREIGEHLSRSNKKTRTEKIMLIIVESGVLYFLLLLEFVIGDIPKVLNAKYAKYNLTFANLVWTYIANHLLGIYPALMVILVNSQRSCLEESIISIHTMNQDIRTQNVSVQQPQVLPIRKRTYLSCV